MGSKDTLHRRETAALYILWEPLNVVGKVLDVEMSTVGGSLQITAKV